MEIVAIWWSYGGYILIFGFMVLTNNFNSSEFACKDATAVPSALLGNLLELARNLQVLRDELGAPITIRSGFRTISHNQKIGGAKNSYHLRAMAADFVVPGYTTVLVFTKIFELIKNGKMKPGGLHAYGSWVHYDIRGFLQLYK